MHHPDARILIFAKAPIPGLAKRRLIPAIGPEGAAALQAELVQRVVATACTADLAAVECWCTPDPSHPCFAELAERYPISLHAQTGSDLGGRMHAALTSAHLLCRALDALAGAADIVIAPAEDGGYGLIGVRQAAPELFRNMPWGSDRVLAATRSRIQALGWRHHELPTLWDLDRPEDLARYRRLSG